MKENENVIMLGGKSDTPAQHVKKSRNSNLELYRIIVMLMIVAHHYVVNGSGLSNLLEANPYRPETVFYYLFGAWGKTGINCFVLITGYFMCKSQITLRKFLKLVVEVIFYSIIIYALFCITGYTQFSAKEAVMKLLPIRSVETGFTSSFLLFYLTIPFLNIFVHNATKKIHIAAIALLLFIYTVLPMAMVPVSYNYVSWFVELYLIASYMRFYGLPRNDSVKVWGRIALVTFLGSICSIVAPLALHRGCTYFFVSDSNHIMALLTAVTSFMFFKNLNVPQNKHINAIASTTFGIFLIHTNSETMRQFLWVDLFDNPGHYNQPLLAVVFVILLFASCSIIDYIRIITIEKPLLNATEKVCVWVKSKILNDRIYK